MATSERRRHQDVRLADAATQKAQEESKATTDALSSQPFMQGIHHIVNTIGAGASVTVSHKLGRKPRGWWCADVIGGAFVVYRTAYDDKTITFVNPGGVALGFAFWIY